MSASALLYKVRNQVLSTPIVHPVKKTQLEIWGTVKNDSSFPELMA
jgi:hypothetical protein